MCKQSKNLLQTIDRVKYGGSTLTKMGISFFNYAYIGVFFGLLWPTNVEELLWIQKIVYPLKTFDPRKFMEGSFFPLKLADKIFSVLEILIR